MGVNVLTREQQVRQRLMASGRDHEVADVDAPLLQHLDPGKPARSTLTAIKTLCQDSFMFELISALLALLSLTVIVSVLACYNESALPDWPSIFTVGSTLSRSSQIPTCVDQYIHILFRHRWSAFHHDYRRCMHFAIEMALVLCELSPTLGSTKI